MSNVTWYPNNAPIGAFAATSVTTQALTTPGSVCTPDAKNITSAWEIRDAAAFTGTAYSIEWAVGCSTTTTVAQPPQQLNTGNGGGVPPEWSGDPQNPGFPMLWVGAPHLVQLGPSGWLALVGLVGDGAFGQNGNDTSNTAVNVAITLSTDGGQTWTPNSAHLIAPIDGTHGATNHNPESVLVKDIAVAVAPWANAIGTHDVFVVWTTSSPQTATYVTSGAYAFPSKTWMPQQPQISPPLPAITQIAGQLTDLAIVAGTHPVAGNFLELVAPTTGSLAAGQCPGGYAAVAQQWSSWISVNAPIDTHWYSEAAIANAGSNWPKCVGGNHDTATSRYPNVARAALAYDPITNHLVAATTRIRSGDPTGSVDVHLTARTWCACGGTCVCGGNPVGQTTTQVADSSHDDSVGSQREDQFDPFMSVDPSSGQGFIGWYDTAELATTTKNVSSIHGQVQAILASTLAGNRKVFFPTPTTYAFGFELGMYNGASPLGSANKFALGFSDGVPSGNGPPPNFQGGLYTALAAP